MKTEDLTAYREAACDAARRAAVVLEEWRQRFSVREKARFDLVTDADLGSQNAIRSYLLERFPGHAFLGEESVSGVSDPGCCTAGRRGLAQPGLPVALCASISPWCLRI